MDIKTNVKEEDIRRDTWQDIERAKFENHLAAKLKSDKAKDGIVISTFEAKCVVKKLIQDGVSYLDAKNNGEL